MVLLWFCIAVPILDIPVNISGVATFVRDTLTPFTAEDGLSSSCSSSEDPVGCYDGETEFTADELIKLDSEGRCVITEHQIRLALMNTLILAQLKVPAYLTNRQGLEKYL